MRIGRHCGDRVHDLAGGVVGDLAEDRVLALKPFSGRRRNEELGAVGALAQATAGVGHGQDVGLCERQRRVDFVVEDVAGTAGARTQGIAPLNHEVRDDAVEDDTRVQGRVGLLARSRVGPGLLTSRQADEVRDGFRGLLREELEADVAEVGVQCRFHGCMVARAARTRTRRSAVDSPVHPRQNEYPDRGSGGPLVRR